MVIDPLHEVAEQFRIEERHRKLQEFDEEITDERDVHPHADMQQEPAADKVDDRTAESEHQFPDEYQPDESDIPVCNTDIDDGLGEERQDELQQAAGNQSEDDLGKIPPVRPGITREETEGMYFLLGSSFSR
jgi:hypothetical protein